MSTVLDIYRNFAKMFRDAAKHKTGDEKMAFLREAKQYEDHAHRLETGHAECMTKCCAECKQGGVSRIGIPS